VEYPIYHLPLLGGSMTIAVIAIVHVFIAHFSVGSGFLMALAEQRAIDGDDGETLDFLRRYSWLVLLLPYVIGTVTGVGIWFTIAIVSPRAVSLLIHQFVWFWAIEWVFFIVEVVSIHVYCLGWTRMDRREHHRVGWIFAGSSMATLFIINAILTFQLTPGAWQPLAPGAVWTAILNPTYLPTTLLRAVVALALAGVAALALLAFTAPITERVRETVAPLAYGFMLPSLAALPLGGWIVLNLGPRARTFLEGRAPVMLVFLAFGTAAFCMLHVAAGLSLWRRDWRPSTLGATLLVLVAFVAFGSLEFVREGIRKPFIIEGFMYSTGLTTNDTVDKKATLRLARAGGVLRLAPWALPPERDGASLSLTARGEAVYRAACLRCHCPDGYNALRPLVRGWAPDTIRHLLAHMAEVQPAMPPFPGSDGERDALTAYLSTLNTSGGDGR